jgi:hypothetical protein
MEGRMGGRNEDRTEGRPKKGKEGKRRGKEKSSL